MLLRLLSELSSGLHGPEGSAVDTVLTAKGTAAAQLEMAGIEGGGATQGEGPSGSHRGGAGCLTETN